MLPTPSAQTISNDLTLPVVEVFATIQGEGYHTGKSAVFIRLAGCDICCNWCDSKESWDASDWPGMKTEQILEQVIPFGLADVIISGGEPLRYDLSVLTYALKTAGCRTFLETSGAYPITGEWDWICLSPKASHPPLPDVFLKAGELKVVIATSDDLQWAEQQRLQARPDTLFYLQPEWSVRETILPIITRYILKNPVWMLSLQSHKYIGIP